MARNQRQDYLDTTTNYATGINDLQFEKNIKEQRIKERQDQIAIEKFEKREARKEKIKEYKANTVPIYKVKKSFLITTILCVILGLIALFKGFIGESIFTIISGIITFIVGQNIRLGNSQPRLTNTILYNISKSLKDFIDYKIPYEIFENENTWSDMYTVLGMFVFAIIPSDNIFYGLVLIMIILTFFISFASTNISNIYNHVKLLIPACVIGLIIKAIIQYMYMGVIDIDLTNIVLINIFTIIAAYTENLTITKPQ